MGLIRFLLAAAVVWGHSAHGGMLTPYYCVQAFFVISGFYMALVWPKYEGRIALFYFNRYSRLAVSYWIVAAFTLALGARMAHPYLAVPNMAMFGMGEVEFFSINGKLASDFLLVPQGWSLGAELWFYLLLPFLAPLQTRTLCAILAASVMVRLAVMGAALPFFPWQQRFFPAELSFFIIGLLAYRFGPRVNGWAALVAVAASVAFIGHWSRANAPDALGSYALAAAMFVAVPAIFRVTKRSALDRFLGEFSYPVYLVHVLVIALFGQKWALPLSIAFALPLILLVELPTEKFRNSLISSRKEIREAAIG